MIEQHETFLKLLRLGIGGYPSILHDVVKWPVVLEHALQQGLYAIVLDGIEKLPLASRPPQKFLLEWIGMVMQDKGRYVAQQKAAIKWQNCFEKTIFAHTSLKEM